MATSCSTSLTRSTSMRAPPVSRVSVCQSFVDINLMTISDTYIDFIKFEFDFLNMRALRRARPLLENRNECGVAVLAGEFERREAVLVACVCLGAGLQQELDHCGVSEVHICCPQQRCHAELVDDVDVCASRDERARHLDLVVEDRAAEHGDAVAIGEVHWRAEVQQRV